MGPFHDPSADDQTYRRQQPLYAVAALAGSIVVVLGRALDLPPPASAAVGALLCFGIRIGAIRRGWNLPVAPTLSETIDSTAVTQGTRQTADSEAELDTEEVPGEKSVKSEPR